MQFDNEGETLTEEKNDKGMLYAFSCIYRGTSGTSKLRAIGDINSKLCQNTSV